MRDLTKDLLKGQLGGEARRLANFQGYQQLGKYVCGIVCVYVGWVCGVGSVVAACLKSRVALRKGIEGGESKIY